MTTELTGRRSRIADAAPTSTPLDLDPSLATGWQSAAIALRSIMQLDAPMLMRLQVPGHDAILIDLRHHAFEWATPLSDFPVAPGHVEVETEATDVAAPPLFALPGGDLDGLLWNIGLASFEGTAASWLRPGDRYRLTRWPNITQLGISVDQVRMTALLGSRFLSPWELAAASGGDVADAQRLVNAFTLMGIAYSTPDAPEPFIAQAPVRTGLMARLRSRLGI